MIIYLYLDISNTKRMKKRNFTIGLMLAPFFCISQVGIGTSTPNSKSILDISSTAKGFLVPRMTWEQKSDMNLTQDDSGMMVYQTDQPGPPNNYPKGLYFFDGSTWVAPIQNGSTNGQTQRWDGNKWIATSNLFNQGSSIGLGTQSPNTQLQIHSNNASTTRLQLTNGTNNGFLNDGLLVGISQTTNHAHFIQQENRPLWFGTNDLERMRIDSVGNVGINRTNPTAKLDVNGTVRIGASGSILTGILKSSIEVMIPTLPFVGEGVVDIPFPNAAPGATVYVSPNSPMSGILIAYAMVGVDGVVQVKFTNMGPSMAAPMPVVLNITVIQ